MSAEDEHLEEEHEEYEEAEEEVAEEEPQHGEEEHARDRSAPEPAPVEEEEDLSKHEIDELRAAMERSAAAAQYDDMKAACKDQKQSMVRCAGVLASLAGQLKADGRTVQDRIAQKKKDREEIRTQQSDLRSSLEALSGDSAVRRVQQKRDKLEQEIEACARAQQIVDEAVAEGKQPFDCNDVGTRYARFLATRGDLLVKACAQKVHYKCLRESKASTLRGRDLPEIQAEIKETEAGAGSYASIIERLEIDARELSAAGWGHDIDLAAAQAEVDEAAHEFERWRLAVLAEQDYRRDLEKRSESFMQQQQSLLSWCNTQQRNLKELANGDDIVEFCSRLRDLVSRMEGYITVLGDLAEAHLPNPDVTKSLVDLNRAWIAVQVTSYEMLQKTLMEQHASSGLSKEVEWMADFQRGPLQQLLEDAHELLETPENPKEKEVVASALETCKELQNDFSTHLILMEHLTDFEVRMGIIDDQYFPMIRTVLSNLTELCQKLRLSHQTNFKGKPEYDAAYADLENWIGVKDTDTTAWDVAKEKISKLIVNMQMS
ncbi:hypothetical protein DIPPA_35788 [Diplonema papillatum]|nr:hypothetical protein DIPPA_35788 [Diplonema papillatum]